MKRLFIITIVALLYNNSANSNYYSSVKRIDLKGPITNTNIKSLCFDRDGFVWFAADINLCRYLGDYMERSIIERTKNGKRTYNYKVYDLVSDKNKNLWLASSFGLYRYNYDSYNFYEINDKIRNIRKIFPDSKGRVWTTTDDKLYYIKNIGKEEYKLDSLINFKNIISVSEDKDGHIYMANKNSIFKLSSDLKFKKKVEFSKINSDIYITCVHYSEVTPNIIFIGTSRGVYRMNLETDKIRFVSEKLKNSRITCIKVPDRKHIVVGTKLGLKIVHFWGRQCQSLRNKPEIDGTISDNYINDIAISESGTIWVSTHNGVFTLKKIIENVAVNTLGRRQKLKLDGHISSIVQIDYNIMAFATINGVKIYRRHGGEVKHICKHIKTNFISQDKNKNLWIATDEGLYEFDSNYILKNRYFPGRKVIAVNSEYNNSVWCSVNGESYVYTQRGKFIKVEELKDLYVKQFHLSKNGKFRIVDDTGISNINNEGIVRYEATDVDSDKTIELFINSIFQDNYGRIVVLTCNGLFHIEENTEKLVKHELINRRFMVLTSGIQDDNGDYWVTSDNFIIKLNKDLDYSGKYDITDWPVNKFLPNSVYKSNYGALMFGGCQGMVRFNPNRIYRPEENVRVIINNFMLENHVVRVKETINGRFLFTKSVTSTKTIKLKHSENSFSFTFITQNLEDRENINYKFKLEGYDTEWSIKGHYSNRAVYRNIPPGKYRFIVKATDSYGVWSENSDSKIIIVEKSWWMFWYMKLLIVITGVLVFAIPVYLYLKRRKLRKLLQVERNNKDILKKINEMKFQFYTNVSHDLRTPLTLIKGPLEKILTEFHDNKIICEMLQIASRNSDRLMRLIDQLLEFRRVDNNSERPEYNSNNLPETLKAICHDFTLVASEKSVDVRFSTGNFVHTSFDYSFINKIVYNLLDNAFRFIDKGGKIAINLMGDSREYTITISDTGSGISDDDMKNIFTRFYQSEANSGTGFGIGLSIVKRCVESMNGTISVKSKLGEGTAFTIKLPVVKFKDEELTPDVSDNSILAGKAGEMSSEYSRRTVLIVEDDDDMRKFIFSFLSTAYSCITARNGKEAIGIMLDKYPDIVISDVMMPEMDGNELCRFIKSDIRVSHIPLFLLTAKHSPDSQIEGLKNGADDYITKPFNPEILFYRIENMFASREKLISRYKTTIEVTEKDITYSYTDEKFLEKVTSVIKNNISNPEFNIEQLVSELDSSKSVVYRKLKKVADLSINEMIVSVRMKEAKRLIRETDRPITEVAFSVGFSDPKYFSRCFRKNLGYSPSECRYGKSD